VSNHTIDGEPLSVCSTNALLDRLRLEWVIKTPSASDYRDAILAELETRRDWPPTPYEQAAKP
jgi:hypothetical protein